MAVYTLSINFIENLDGDNSHLVDVLFKFCNPRSNYKAAMDKSKKLLMHYENAAAANKDIFTWLDWMSRNPKPFEVIDLEVPESASEEEMYLMVAAATNPMKKIIVGSHQYWKCHYYIRECSRIKYKDVEITILDKDDAYAELNPSEKKVTNISITNHNMNNNNPWISGSFYLTTAVILLSILAVIGKIIDWKVLPVIVLGCVFLVTIVGILQLRNDDKLKDESFVKLISETYKRLPILNRDSKNKS